MKEMTRKQEFIQDNLKSIFSEKQIKTLEGETNMYRSTVQIEPLRNADTYNRKVK